MEIVAGVEGAGQPLAGVPEPGVDGPRLVAELQVEVEVPLSVGPQLLIGHEEQVVDRFAVGQLVHVAAGHAVFWNKQGCRAISGWFTSTRAGSRPDPGADCREG